MKRASGQINKRVIIGQFNNAYNTNYNYEFDIIINREREASVFRLCLIFNKVTVV